MPEIKRALISVSDKVGVAELAQGLHEQGIEILSTGGTAKLLQEHDIPVIEVSEYTGFPEMMAGRVKTLHPKIHGGLLGRRGIDDAVMEEHGIKPIDLLVVNLYPFEQTVSKPGCTLEKAIEHIDIGGPAMLRSAAKNHEFVGVVVDPEDYTALLSEIRSSGELSAASRYTLAMKAFEHTARYDAAIANYLSAREGAQRAKFPHAYTVQYRKKQDLRYGENPHQEAAFYTDLEPEPGCIATAEQLQGKELSYNNIADADAALECVNAFDDVACVIVKHANPCGVAVADSLLHAYEHAFATDPTSSFGGIIAFNRPLDAQTARSIIDKQFVEVICVPSLDGEAAAVLAEKPLVRVLVVGQPPSQPAAQLDYKRVRGGLLIQDRDQGTVDFDDLKIVTKRPPSDHEIRDLFFAWRVVKHVKSNAIVYARDGRTIGIGAGQMSRVYSARIAAIKAADEGLEIEGSVMASDAFFPFRDSVDIAAETGIRAIIQPGGSVNDEDVIAAADEHDIAMVFTGMRHFRH